jgi:hypothetical protein
MVLLLRLLIRLLADRELGRELLVVFDELIDVGRVSSSLFCQHGNARV